MFYDNLIIEITTILKFWKKNASVKVMKGSTFKGMEGSISKITFDAKKFIKIIEVQNERIVSIQMGFIAKKIILIIVYGP